NFLVRPKPNFIHAENSDVDSPPNRFCEPHREDIFRPASPALLRHENGIASKLFPKLRFMANPFALDKSNFMKSAFRFSACDESTVKRALEIVIDAIRAERGQWFFKSRKKFFLGKNILNAEAVLL